MYIATLYSYSHSSSDQVKMMAPCNVIPRALRPPGAASALHWLRRQPVWMLQLQCEPGHYLYSFWILADKAAASARAAWWAGTASAASRAARSRSPASWTSARNAVCSPRSVSRTLEAAHAGGGCETAGPGPGAWDARPQRVRRGRAVPRLRPGQPLGRPRDGVRAARRMTRMLAHGWAGSIRVGGGGECHAAP
jgi:hypothetical protein